MSHRRESNNYKAAEQELRRGPWTLEEDTLLVHYIALHGEGRWNLLARSSGLKRTGKSCRLRWLNYLKPDVKRGNLSPEEQFLIHELHSKWGNRWSRIAQHLPGRTDNEIKNYWRTRVQKQARQLRINANDMKFREELRRYWMPKLLEKMSSPSHFNPQSAKLETTIADSTTPEVFKTSMQRPAPFDDSVRSENCSSAAEVLFQPQTDLNDMSIDLCLNDDYYIDDKSYDELDLASAMLASPAEIIPYFDWSNYVDYNGFSDVLWN